MTREDEEVIGENMTRDEQEDAEFVSRTGFAPPPPVTVNEHKRSKPRKPRQAKPGPRSHERIAADLVKQAQRVKDAESRLTDARKAWDALLREAAEVGK